MVHGYTGKNRCACAIAPSRRHACARLGLDLPDAHDLSKPRAVTFGALLPVFSRRGPAT